MSKISLLLAQVAQVAQMNGKALHPRGVSELNPCLPGFRRPPASLFVWVAAFALGCTVPCVGVCFLVPVREERSPGLGTEG